MRILHVISSLPKTGGGTSEIIPKICTEQVRAGLDVWLAYRNTGTLPDSAVAAKKAGVKLIPFAGLVSTLNRISFSWEMFRKLEHFVAEADIVHIHGGWLFAVWWAVHCARKCCKPYVMMPHGSLEPERLKISKWKKRIVGALFDRRAYRDAAMVWVTAESEAEGVRRYGVTCPIKVVPLGLDVQPYENSRRDVGLLARLGVSTDKKLLLYFSRLTKFKGLDMLANVWARLSSEFLDWQLVVAGPDDYHGYRSEIEAQFNACCPKESFVFTGPVYGRDKFNMLKSVSTFVLPTRNENFSIAVAEALASGVPVVCTKGAPWGEIEGKCGRWVDISEDGIARGLREVLSATEDERTNMGVSGIELVKNKYCWESIVNLMVESYKKVSQ